MIDGELYVATLKKKKPAKKAKATLQDSMVLLQENSKDVFWDQTKKALLNEDNLEHIDLVHAWAMTAKMVQGNSRRIQAHQRTISQNAEEIHRLEAQMSRQ